MYVFETVRAGSEPAHDAGAVQSGYVVDSAVTAKAKADKYAKVPTFSDNMPLYDEESGRKTAAKTASSKPGSTQEPVAKTAPPRGEEALGAGRVVPESHRPVKPTGTAKRAQPTRQPRSKRGKK